MNYGNWLFGLSVMYLLLSLIAVGQAWVLREYRRDLDQLRRRVVAHAARQELRWRDLDRGGSYAQPLHRRRVMETKDDGGSHWVAVSCRSCRQRWTAESLHEADALLDGHACVPPAIGVAP